VVRMDHVEDGRDLDPKLRQRRQRQGDLRGARHGTPNGGLPRQRRFDFVRRRGEDIARVAPSCAAQSGGPCCVPAAARRATSSRRPTKPVAKMEQRGLDRPAGPGGNGLLASQLRVGRNTAGAVICAWLSEGSEMTADMYSQNACREHSTVGGTLTKSAHLRPSGLDAAIGGVSAHGTKQPALYVNLYFRERLGCVELGRLE